MADDLFDSILHLEDDFYREGYALGEADGAPAGRLEGRAFGLEKGFEKYAEMGRLHGKAVIWASRLQRQRRADLHMAMARSGGAEGGGGGGGEGGGYYGCSCTEQLAAYLAAAWSVSMGTQLAIETALVVSPFTLMALGGAWVYVGYKLYLYNSCVQACRAATGSLTTTRTFLASVGPPRLAVCSSENYS